MVDEDGFVEKTTTKRPRNLNVTSGNAKPNGASGKATATARGPKRSLKNDIARVLTYLNFGFLFLPPQFHQDALDPAEIEALSTALDKQAQTNARVYRLVESAVSGEITGQFVIVSLLIISRRLARHGMIPQQFDQAAGQLLTIDPDDLKNFILDAEQDAGLSEPDRTATIIQ